jgi:hypothetical protein
MWWDVVDWIQLVQNIFCCRISISVAKSLRVPLNIDHQSSYYRLRIDPLPWRFGLHFARYPMAP